MKIKIEAFSTDRIFSQANATHKSAASLLWTERHRWHHRSLGPPHWQMQAMQCWRVSGWVRCAGRVWWSLQSVKRHTSERNEHPHCGVWSSLCKRMQLPYNLNCDISEAIWFSSNMTSKLTSGMLSFVMINTADLEFCPGGKNTTRLSGVMSVAPMGQIMYRRGINLQI